MTDRRTQFTSEAVAMGHPDKAADQVSDAILDAMIREDPEARVACEVLLTDELGVISGEISGEISGKIDDRLEAIARETLLSIGYDSREAGFDAGSDPIIVKVQRQSPDIARGVDREDKLGAGDQGMMFGYAIDHTPELMPLPIVLAHRLVARQAEVRAEGAIEGLLPDAKSQVTVDFEGGSPKAITSVVLSTQHSAAWNDRQDALRDAVTEAIVMPVLGAMWRDDIEVLVNPTGRFEIGGPAGDTGLTGRKIIVDTYGGWARHGGGAFSGKDPSKVDRSAAYMARYIAKNVVAAEMASECEVRLSYAIGVAEPKMVALECRGLAAGLTESAIEDAVGRVFVLTPQEVIDHLELKSPIYQPTACHGHFGRTPDEPPGFFTWERTDRVDLLRQALG